LGALDQLGATGMQGLSAMFSKTLRREILLLLALKGIFLTVLYFAFFSPAHRTEMTPRYIQARLLGK